MLFNQKVDGIVNDHDRFFIGNDLFGNSLELIFLGDNTLYLGLWDEHRCRKDSMKMTNEAGYKMAKFIIERTNPIDLDDDDSFADIRNSRAKLDKDIFNYTLEIFIYDIGMVDIAIYDESHKRVKGMKINEEAALAIARLIVNRLAK